MCAPDMPTAQESATAQTGTNVSTAIANAHLGNVNQVTPYGSLTYSQTGSYDWLDPASGQTYQVPTFTATQSLTPGGQAIQDNIMDAQTNLSQTASTASGRLNEMLSGGINLGNAPAAGISPNMGRVGQGPRMQTVGRGPSLQQSIGNAGAIRNSYGSDFSQDRQRVEQAIMGRAQGGLDNDRRALEARLADQGIEIGSSAYQSAMDDYGRQVNDMRTSAILAGGQEQSRMVGMEADRAAFNNQAQAQRFGQNATRAGFRNDARQQGFQNRLAGAGFNNTARQQGFQNQIAGTGFNNQAAGQEFGMQNQARNQYLQEQYTNRNQGLNELLSLMSGSQVQNPSFANTSSPQMPTVDIAGMMQQEGANNMSQWRDMMGGLGGIASLFRLSDRRAKTDISKVGKTNDGQDVYSYRYKHEGKKGPVHMGLMAQEVEKRKPDAVQTGADGLKRVNYGIALGV